MYTWQSYHELLAWLRETAHAECTVRSRYGVFHARPHSAEGVWIIRPTSGTYVPFGGNE